MTNPERRTPDPGSSRSLTATYRLQLNRDFGLRRALEIVPYLERLGISHVYCSPILTARPGSMHGYDVADPTHINPEIGTLDDLRALSAALRERGMGLVVDIVPNHMGIGPDNCFWRDVLTHGEHSRWARWFDVDWDGAGGTDAARHRIVLPVLGDELDAVLARGELALELDEEETGWRLRYFDNVFPLDPATLPDALQLAQLDPEAVHASGREPGGFARDALGVDGMRALLDAQHYRLVHWRRGPTEINYRRFFDVNELAALRMEDLEVFTATHAMIRRLIAEGIVDGLRVDHVDGLLDPLEYLERLHGWRRRSGDVAPGRIEGPRGGEPTGDGGTGDGGTGNGGQGEGDAGPGPAGEERGAPPAGEGTAAIDGEQHHSDAERGGIAQAPSPAWGPPPTDEGTAVRAGDRHRSAASITGSPPDATPDAARDASPAAGRPAIPFPIFVEKILSPGERLPVEWPVQGTTGYEFLNDLEDVFLDPAGYAEIERCYHRLRRIEGVSFADVAHAGKVRILTGPLRADVERLARLLQPVVNDVSRHGAPAAGHAAPRAWATADLADGIVQLIAALPVYRTYIDGRGAPRPEDVAVLEIARARARERNPATAEVSDLVADVLLQEPGVGVQGGHGGPPLPLLFTLRFQQTSGPATAKGVEDTALYAYVPLASRNEVGGAPDRPLDDAVARLHAANAERAARWPLSLLCTNTHDTKRSADVRARLDVLSELPREWARCLARWRRLNRKHRSVVRGRLAPDTNTEYLFYQTLVGLWPTPRPGRRADDLPDRDWLRSARGRLHDYMLKAVREAKLRTSWTEPDAGFEAALARFIDAALEPPSPDDDPWLADVARLVARIAPAGCWNALARVLVHLTAPGTPDLYQGDELWTFTLVDPDNRRAVDYEARERLLEGSERVEGRGSRAERPGFGGRGSAFGNVETRLFPSSPEAKLHVTTSLLRTRRSDPDLFAHGDYTSLDVRGARARHVIAYARSFGERRAIVVAPRLVAGLGLGARPADEVWGDTVVVLPGEWRTTEWRSVLDGRSIGSVGDGAGLPVASVFDGLPLALLRGGPDAPREEVNDPTG